MDRLAPNSHNMILNSHQAHLCFKPLLTADVEELWVMALDAGQGVRGVERIFRGTVDACLVHPRDIFRFGCAANASSLIIAHNHPSGDILPSTDDIRITKRLVQLGIMMQMPIQDHLILGARGYISMADLSLCGFGRRRSLRG